MSEPKRVRRRGCLMSAGVAPDDPLDYHDGIEVFDDDPADWDEALIQVREVEIELRSLADVTDDKKHSDFLEQLADQLHAAMKPKSEK